MRRVTGWTTAAVLLLGGVAAGCGSDDKDSASSDKTTTTASDSSASDSSDGGSSSSSGNDKVDAYCKEVDDVVAASKKAMSDPTSADAKKAAQQAKDLGSTAASLAGELISDPSLAKQVSDCTKKLQNINSG